MYILWIYLDVIRKATESLSDKECWKCFLILTGWYTCSTQSPQKTLCYSFFLLPFYSSTVSHSLRFLGSISSPVLCRERELSVALRCIYHHILITFPTLDLRWGSSSRWNNRHAIHLCIDTCLVEKLKRMKCHISPFVISMGFNVLMPAMNATQIITTAIWIIR